MPHMPNTPGLGIRTEGAQHLAPAPQQQLEQQSAALTATRAPQGVAAAGTAQQTCAPPPLGRPWHHPGATAVAAGRDWGCRSFEESPRCGGSRSAASRPPTAPAKPSGHC